MNFRLQLPLGVAPGTFRPCCDGQFGDVVDRYDGEKRNTFNEMECGSNYARSMASYSLIPAFSGFTYDMTNREMTNIKTDLLNFVNTQMAKFLTEGVTDASWDEYVQRLDDYKADRYMGLYQKYYDLYNQN